MALQTTQIQMRNGTTAQWNSATPTMLAGEIGYNTDTRKIKIGDGSNNWSALNYYNDTLDNNYIIDGNFQIAQVNPTVGTEITNPATGSYPVFDLWRTNFDANGGTFPTVKHSQQLITSGSVPNSKYCHRINVNGAGTSLGASSYYALNHIIEHGTQNLCGLNKKVTLSFYAKSTISNKKIGVHLEQNYGTGGSPSGAEVITGNKFTLTSSWAKYTHTFTTNTLVGKTFGTGSDDFVRVAFLSQWGATTASVVGDVSAETFVGSGDIEIAQVKLEPGDTATTFMPRPYDVELRRCQRYLFNMDALNNVLTTYSVGGNGYSSTVVNGFGILFPTRMRIAPVISSQSAANTFWLSNATATLTPTAVAIDRSTPFGCAMSVTVASGAVAGTHYVLLSANTTASYLRFDSRF